MSRDILKKVKKIVVKVGTSTLTKADGTLNEEFIKSLVVQICELKRRGYDVVLVSSGAVGAGMGRMKFKEKPCNISQKQALAAVGQVSLMHLYEYIFWAYSSGIAQLLLTRGDFSDRKRYLNVRNVCNQLLSWGIVPIINENDPVVADELKVGDNDTLSALVAGLIDADLVIILSDIDGLYDKNPNEFKDAKLINLVQNIDKSILKMAGGEGSKFGTGGMATKLTAAKMANKIGANLIIANGKDSNVLLKILDEIVIGTLFVANANKLNSRKYWLAYGATQKGFLSIDDGAVKAIKSGKSLLSVGVNGVGGEFERGEIVSVRDSKNELIACGIVNYSSSEIALINGRKSEEIEQILGYKYDDDLIHADNIAIN
ncbi:glutamate 5-kinase [Campylobacter sp. faydin G-24]|uniref:Glutamate 5-kinase n=1 Tax=Campylobacter anatolicus TaxID=2829105 RepID=A0ABS5HK35_9BACT|nr:glutamate 5-kinase [Campylobacter anatolicus]MBR8461276.1 glutamate 5-kinase [Campylobacter anatolicus]MBR8464635.1 glutamate 5-kinase [Campylobacter anatolicus]